MSRGLGDVYKRQGYKRRYMKGGKLGSIASNILDRKFSPDMPNQAWVSDITSDLLE